MTTRDLNDEVFAARRIASQHTQLGPVYDKIARKCLQGNFGTEPDLGHKNLQTAVYNDVICELESMLQKLEVKNGVFHLSFQREPYNRIHHVMDN